MASKHDDIPMSWTPFRRTDPHGGRWWPRGAWIPCAQQALGMVLWLPVRACFALILILCFAGICALAMPPSGSSRKASVRNKRWVARLGRWAARGVLWTMGVARIHVVDVSGKRLQAAGLDDDLITWPEGTDVDDPGPCPCALWVSNHVSFVDVLVHMALNFPSFVSREETGRTPLVGGIARAMECVFVRREKVEGSGIDPGNAVRASQELARRARLRAQMVEDGRSDVDVQAPPVVVFAEGTTSNGKQLLTFRTGAFLTGSWIRPVVLRYRPLWWASFSPAWESVSAVQHVVLMLSQGAYGVEVIRLPPCAPSRMDRGDPVAFAQAVRARMSLASGLPCVSATFQDKRAYHAHLRSLSNQACDLPTSPPNRREKDA